MFITVEGIEGVGKTTNMEYLQQLILAAGRELVVTREPGGTQLGEAIRGLRQCVGCPTCLGTNAPSARRNMSDFAQRRGGISGCRLRAIAVFSTAGRRALADDIDGGAGSDRNRDRLCATTRDRR